MFVLKNKVIVITGATGVLASSLAISLAKNNARLVLLGRNQKLLDELTKKINQYTCLLYTSPSPRDLSTSRMPSSA